MKGSQKLQLVLVAVLASWVPVMGGAQERPADEWRIDPTPLLSIGELEGPAEYVLPRVFDATLLSDGVVVVGIFSSNLFELRYFDADGQYLVSAGRFGDGPFEVGRKGFQEIGRILGDSVLVVGRDDRYSVFGPRGEHGRSGRYQGVWPFLELYILDQHHLALVREGSSEQRGDGLYVTTADYVIVDTRSMTSEAVWASPGLGMWTGPPAGITEVPFSVSTRADAGGGVFWFGDPGTAELHVLSLATGEITAVHGVAPRIPVTGAIESRYKEHDLGDSEGDWRRVRAARHRQIEFPDTLPAFKHVKVDPLGNAWVERYEPRWSQDDYQWDIYSPSGTWLGTVTAPFGLLNRCLRSAPFGGCPHSQYEIGTDYLLSVVSDDLGVERVKKYTLARD